MSRQRRCVTYNGVCVSAFIDCVYPFTVQCCVVRQRRTARSLAALAGHFHAWLRTQSRRSKPRRTHCRVAYRAVSSYENYAREKEKKKKKKPRVRALRHCRAKWPKTSSNNHDWSRAEFPSSRNFRGSSLRDLSSNFSFACKLQTIRKSGIVLYETWVKDSNTCILGWRLSKGYPSVFHKPTICIQSELASFLRDSFLR